MLAPDKSDNYFINMLNAESKIFDDLFIDRIQGLSAGIH